jgi:hypothetical protein
VQRLLVHRAAVQRVDGALVGARPPLEAALEQRGDRALRAAGRAPQQQDPPPRLVALGGRVEVPDDTLQRHVEAEQVGREEAIGHLPGVQAVRPAGGLDHVRHALMRRRGDRRPLRHPIDVLVEGDQLRGLGRPLPGGFRQRLLELHGAPLKKT